MNKLLSGLILVTLGAATGYLAQQHISDILESSGLVKSSNMKSARSSGEKEILYWVAPMDANYRRDEPGKSPMGMDLVPVYADDGNTDDGVVKISSSVENNLGVRVSPVHKGTLSRNINTVGYVNFDEEKIFHVHSRVEGWVERLQVKSVGQTVKKGQKLFELYSPDLVNAQEEFLTALKSKNNTLINASQSRLGFLGVGDSQINNLKKTRKVQERIDIYSKYDGFINELNIREGMFIKPATDVLSIGQIDTVWVIAEVFEQQSGWINIGQKVDMEVGALPGKSWQGTVDYIYPVLDSKTRTLQVRVRFDNSDEQLKPNMYAKLNIHAQTEQETLFIPREALIRSGTMDRVVKSLGGGEYLSVAVKTGIESGSAVEILKGLKADEKIVTSAQFLIDSESSLTASFERMQDPTSTDKEITMQMPVAIKPVAALDNSQAWVKGIINSIDLQQSRVNVNHEPVEVWGWPSMMMDFPVSKSVDITQFSIGQSMQFLVKKLDSGGIQIINVKQEQ
jgi:membrane fusion protein, copper/silver efflux system